MASGSGKDKVTGKAKEAMGKMTGSQRQEAEGKAQQAKGEMKKKLSGDRTQR